MTTNGQVLEIIKLGHQVLRAVSEPVADPTARWVQELIKDMQATLIAAGGVGLAAPQVARGYRIIILRIPDDGHDSGNNPRTEANELVVINPEIESVGQERALGWEGCLSIPDLQGLVPRYTSIRYRGLDLSGLPIVGLAHGFTARVFQHEVDHLDGKFYLDRMDDLSSLTFIRERRYTTEPVEVVQDEPQLEPAHPPELGNG